jgi:hypothetical protein
MVRYKLTFIARDETAEAVMFSFDNVAKRIVGKPCEIVLRSMTPSVRIQQTYLVSLLSNSHC